MQPEYTDAQITALEEYRSLLTFILEAEEYGRFEEPSTGITCAPENVQLLRDGKAVMERLRDADLGAYADELQDLWDSFGLDALHVEQDYRTFDGATDLSALRSARDPRWVLAPREGDVLSVDLRALTEGYASWGGSANDAAHRMVDQWLRAGMTVIEGTVSSTHDGVTVCVEGVPIRVMDANNAEHMIELEMPLPLKDTGLIPLSMITDGLVGFEAPSGAQA